MSDGTIDVPEHDRPNLPTTDAIPAESQETAQTQNGPTPLLALGRDRWPVHGKVVSIDTPSGPRWFRVLQAGRKRLLEQLTGAETRKLEGELRAAQRASDKDRTLHLLWWVTFAQLAAADAARVGQHVRFWRIVAEHVDLWIGYRAQPWYRRAEQYLRGVQPGGWVWRRRTARLVRR